MIQETDKLTNKQVIDEKNLSNNIKAQLLHHLPYDNSTITPINYSNKMHTHTLLQMEEIPFFAIEQPNVTTIPALQKHDNRTPDKFMAILWNLGGDSISIKRNTNIGSMKESDYVENLKINKKILRTLLR